MPDQPTLGVAPFQSCIACFTGDTTTAVSIEGDAEFHVAALIVFAGLGPREAQATFLAFTEYDMGLPSGQAPTGRFKLAFRLCRDCAAKTGAEVIEVGETGTGYVQPEPEA